MNYLVGLILIGVNYDEVTGFAILEKIMGEYGQMSSLYGGQLIKLFSLSDHIYTWMLTEEPELEQLITSHGVPLTTLLAGPFMALFANILSLDSSLLVLDRLLLHKEGALIDIVQHVFRQSKGTLLSEYTQKRESKTGNSIMASGDKSGQLQAYLVRLIYIEAE